LSIITKPHKGNNNSEGHNQNRVLRLRNAYNVYPRSDLSRLNIVKVTKFEYTETKSTKPSKCINLKPSLKSLFTEKIESEYGYEKTKSMDS